VAAVRPGGEGFGAGVHDHLVEVRVARGGDLRCQVRPGDLHQRVGQACPAGRGTRPGMLGGAGVLGGVAVRAVRVLAVTRGRAQCLQHHRAVGRGQLGADRH
jgi:hypothetical protein